MQLTTIHTFEAPFARVVGALTSDDYLRELAQQHSLFAEIEPLSIVQNGSQLQRVLRYRARPFMARLGLFSLPAEWFAWTEYSQLELESGLLRFENVPLVESVRSHMMQRGTLQFRAQLGEDGVERTLRETRFEVALEVPSRYRPLAELALSMVGRQLASSLDEEAALLASWLGRGRELALTA